VLAGQGVHSVHVGKTDVYNQAGKLGFSEMILPGDRFVSRKPLDVQKDSEGRAGERVSDPAGPVEVRVSLRGSASVI